MSVGYYGLADETAAVGEMTQHLKMKGAHFSETELNREIEWREGHTTLRARHA